MYAKKVIVLVNYLTPNWNLFAGNPVRFGITAQVSRRPGEGAGVTE